MLFPSYVFLFAFLPTVFVAALFLSRSKNALVAAGWLCLASLFFYAWWRPAYLPLLLGSAAFNYGWGLLLARVRQRWLLALGVVANLGLLGWFKYSAFAAQTWTQITGHFLDAGSVLLPLAISFFTFQQIAYLVEGFRGGPIERNPLRYLLFVSFFPQLIAGPIVHYDEIGPQLSGRNALRIRAVSVAVGVSFLVFGLFKKIVFADGVAPMANAVFGTAAAGNPLSTGDAWLGTLAYTLQIYFDFSGYSDMAIGLGLIFGVRLPINFNSPYQATSVVDFWRRWHMTLSRFLRDYLYIPLGGNRRGTLRRYTNLMLTMLLGGLWHGAAWTFVVWGGLHGFYLLVNHAWQRTRRQRTPSVLGIGASRALTFLVVMLAWVFFRATDFASASLMLSSLAGMGDLPEIAVLDAKDGTLALLPPLAIALFAPNTQQIFGAFLPRLERDPEIATPSLPRLFRWRPSPAWAVALAGAAAWAILQLGGVNEFLYFNF
ncbi:MAG: MBOAT family protein [Myxococcales bacterium]|nr:MBOAT family protein [Myxococcales bacterium]